MAVATPDGASNTQARPFDDAVFCSPDHNSSPTDTSAEMIGASCAYSLAGRTCTIEPARREEADVAKKGTSSRAGETRQSKSSAKRDLVRGPQASSNAKRTAKNRFKETDDVGRSQKADKTRKAKKAVGSGYGDQGDRKPPRLGVAKAYAALGLAKGLRAAARTMSLARGEARKS